VGTARVRQDELGSADRSDGERGLQGVVGDELGHGGCAAGVRAGEEWAQTYWAVSQVRVQMIGADFADGLS